MREFRLEVAAPMTVTVLSPVEFQFYNLHFEPVSTELLLQVYLGPLGIQHVQASVYKGREQKRNGKKSASSPCASSTQQFMSELYVESTAYKI